MQRSYSITSLACTSVSIQKQTRTNKYINYVIDRQTSYIKFSFILHLPTIKQAFHYQCITDICLIFFKNPQHPQHLRAQYSQEYGTAEKQPETIPTQTFIKIEQPKTNPRPISSFTVKEDYIGTAVSKLALQTKNAYYFI